MPIPYVVPLLLKAAVASGQASVVGAIIKDNATGRILGHMQQTTGLQTLLGKVLDPFTSAGGFSPLCVAQVPN